MLEVVPLPPWKRYSLAIDCLVDPWILRSYLEICSTVDYPSSELILEFSRRNEMDKLSNLLRIREDHRTKLLSFTYNTALYYPYPSTSPPTTSICAACLLVLKALLQRVLLTGGLSDLDGADGVQFPLLEERLMKGIQPRTQGSLVICANCRTKEKVIVDQVVGAIDLEKEVKKVMHIAS
jgi:hypothetical protein